MQARRTMSLMAALLRVAPALRSRNFRLFWIGQIISTIGTSLQVVAEGWLIYELTQSTFWLGMVGLLALIPVLPISLLGGVLIDRVPRRKLLIATQVGLLAQATVFAVLALSGRLELWHIIVLYFIFGALLAIDHPARRAFLVELVDEDTEENIRYQIVGEDEADIKIGMISINSPIARALIAKMEGDVVSVTVPGGERSLEIVEVRYE